MGPDKVVWCIGALVLKFESPWWQLSGVVHMKSSGVLSMWLELLMVHLSLVDFCFSLLSFFVICLVGHIALSNMEPKEVSCMVWRRFGV